MGLSRKYVAAILLMVLVALMLSAAVAAGGSFLLQGNQFGGVVIALASEEGDASLDLLVDLLSTRKDIQSFATLETATPQEAEEQVKTGQAQVAVIFPKGFLDSVMTGENLSPKLVVDASRPLEMMVTVKLADSALRMLVRTQQGIGYTLAVYKDRQLTQPPVDRVVQDINFAYAGWVIGYNSMFRSSLIQGPGQIGLLEHYGINGILFFALLSLPVFYNLLALQPQKGWLGRIKSSGGSISLWAVCQILAVWLVILLMLALLAAGMVAAGGGLSLSLVPGLLAVSFFMACFAWLCCNTGSILSAVSTVFLLSVFGLLVSGGLIPRVLLPGALAQVGAFSPLLWMYQIFAPVFGADVQLLPLLFLTSAALLLFGACLLVSRHRESEGLR